MAFPDGWSHKWAIAINADSVISSPVADWPCLVTDAHFPAGAWALMQETGADLRFSSDEAGASELYYDAPRLSVAGESAHLYVRVPSLASGADTTIYGWCGNGGATAPSAAWMQSTYPADWVAHWPMEEGSGAVVGDRTSNGYDGTLRNGSWATVGDDTIISNNGKYPMITLPADAYGSGAHSILSRFNLATVKARHGLLIMADAGDQIWWWVGREYIPDGTMRLAFYNGSVYLRNTTQINTAQTYTGAVVNSVAAAAFYLDGSADGTGAPGSLTTWNKTFGVGSGISPLYTSFALNGLLYNTAWIARALTADEIAIHHQMLSSPETFAAAGELVAISTGRAHFGGRNLGKPMFRRQNL